MEEENKESKVAIGTLYDLNKGLVKQNEIKLSKEVLNSKKEIVMNFLRKTNNNFYMLLCNERKDYTIFNLKNNFIYNEKDKRDAVSILIDECLPNRGEIRGIDLTKNQDAIEIWMIIDDDAYVYYFFPYDEAIIEIGG